MIYAYHYKWLCAPKGAGFLYARPEVQALLDPLVISWGWQSEMPGTSQFVDHHEWQGTRDLSPFLAVPAAIRFQQENNWTEVQDDCHALALEAEMRIRGLMGLSSLYIDDSWFAQMVAVLLPVGTDSVALKEFLYHNYRIEVPVIEWNGTTLLRVSIQGYNLSRDIDALMMALTDWESA